MTMNCFAKVAALALVTVTTFGIAPAPSRGEQQFYAVNIWRNDTNLVIPGQYRWGKDAPWKDFVIPPRGGRFRVWWGPLRDDVDRPTLYVRFDCDPNPGITDVIEYEMPTFSHGAPIPPDKDTHRFWYRRDGKIDMYYIGWKR
jgi:hypothetical protein